MSNNSARVILHGEGTSIGAWSAFGVHHNPLNSGSQSNPTTPPRRTCTSISSRTGPNTLPQGIRGNYSFSLPLVWPFHPGGIHPTASKPSWGGHLGLATGGLQGDLRQQVGDTGALCCCLRGRSCVGQAQIEPCDACTVLPRVLGQVGPGNWGGRWGWAGLQVKGQG